jgi:hypothetical protein
MHKLKDFRIEIDRRTDSEGAGGDLRVWMRWELREETEGIRWGSFLMLGEEWRDLFEMHRSEFSDGMHHLHTFDESWMFYDLDVPREDTGVMPLRFTRLSVPHEARRQITARIEAAIDRYDSDERSDTKWPISLDFTEDLAEWSRDYGRGKGSIEIIADAGTRDALGTWRGDPTFDRCWESIEAIALATTNSIYDKAPIRIHARDWSGRLEFAWSAGRLHGGIIDHGSDESPDWSVHT